MSDNKTRNDELDSDELDLSSVPGVRNDAAIDFDAAHASGEPLTRDEELESMRRDVEEANKRVLMAQADSENFRKRMRRDYEDQLRFASLPLINDILQVRDNLNRAADAAGASESVQSLRDGVSMVAKQLDDTLAKYGVKPVDDSGEFDPNIHEAISQMPSPEHAAGQIAHVAVTGYMLHERVIRPSQVVVSTGSP